MSRRPARLRLVLACSLTSIATALLLLGGAAALPRKHSPYHKLDIFTRVLSYVENNYVEEVDQEELVYGAIKGMLETLDPHSAFLNPEEYQRHEGRDRGRVRRRRELEVELRDGKARR